MDILDSLLIQLLRGSVGNINFYSVKRTCIVKFIPIASSDGPENSTVGFATWENPQVYVWLTLTGPT